MGIAVGDRTEHDFSVSEEDMRWFARLSGDSSLIHSDAGFARERGFDDVIVYGGLMLAHLSHVVGMKLPGPMGTSTRWAIDYRRPLYVGETATIAFEVVGVSPGTGLIDGKYKIRAAGRLIASGTTQSLLPTDQCQP
jgi:acyl dehydratase